MRYIIIFLILFTVFLNINFTLAYNFNTSSGLNETAEGTGHLPATTFFKDLPTGVGKAIGMFIAVLGVIFLGLMIYGGFIWMIARGEEVQVEKAKGIIKNSLVGIIIILAAYLIVFLFAKFFIEVNN